MVNFKFEYVDLSLETKKFINKAIDIYLALRNKKIRNFGKENVEYITGIEKKCIALYLAGFFIDNELKDILKYGNVSVEKMLVKLGLSQSEIINHDDKDYKEFYDSFFHSLLKNLFITYDRIGVKFYNINKITPETINYVVYSGLSCFSTQDLANACDFLDDYIISIFRVAEKAEKEKSISKRTEENDNNIKKLEIDNIFPKEYNYNIDPCEKKIKFVRDSRLDLDDDIENVSDSSDIDFDSDAIWDILNDIKDKFIGQEILSEYLFYNIVNNQQLIQNGIVDGERSIIFIDGPTGTGKTAITREITSRLDIPIVSSSITNFSSTGYVGGNLTDLLKELYKKAGKNLEKAERGIVVLDEFDKIAYNSKGGLEMKRAVQQQLLDFMGGGKYSIQAGSNSFSFFDEGKVEFDTSNLTFICLAALSNLRDDKTKVTRTIGFGEDFQNKTETYSITPEDLMNIGLERELVGRFNTYLHTEEYSKEDLLNILTKSTISPMLGFEKWVKSKGKYLTVEDGVYELIAEIASKLKTGARSLQTVVNSIRTHFLREVLRGDKKEVILDCETINNIYGNIVNRKSKK